MNIRLDPDVEKQRGRYVPVDLGLLIKKIVVSPDAKPWFREVVKSAVRKASLEVGVCGSSIDAKPGADP